MLATVLGDVSCVSPMFSMHLYRNGAPNLVGFLFVCLFPVNQEDEQVSILLTPYLGPVPQQALSAPCCC